MTKRAQVARRSREEAREWLASYGVSLTEFARIHGLTRMAVSDALRGRTKGSRGAAHRAAVALGIKPAPKGPPPRANAR